jgi:DNA-binding transcriptional regulator YhcF (GntR family)
MYESNLPSASQEHFPGKRLTRVFSGHKAPLTLNAVLVYCRLAYLDAYGKGDRKGATYQELARATGLDRKTAVPTAIRSLQQHGLAVRRGQRWHAVAPAGETADWFVPLRHAEADAHWYKRFAYYWLPTRSQAGQAQLTPAQTAVLAKRVNLWLDRPQARQSARGLAQMLNLNVKTVRSALARLREVGVLDRADRPLPLQAEQLALFVAKKKRADKAKALWAPSFNFRGPDKPLLDDLLGRALEDMRAAGYSENRIRAFWEWAFKIQVRHKEVWTLRTLVWRFAKLFPKVEADHARNKAAGKNDAATSEGLLRFVSRPILLGKR